MPIVALPPKFGFNYSTIRLPLSCLGRGARGIIYKFTGAIHLFAKIIISYSSYNKKREIQSCVELLQILPIYRHHEHISFHCRQSVGPIRVNRLYYERPFPFVLKFSFTFMGGFHWSSYHEDKFALLKSPKFNSLIV